MFTSLKNVLPQIVGNDHVSQLIRTSYISCVYREENSRNAPDNWGQGYGHVLPGSGAGGAAFPANASGAAFGGVDSVDQRGITHGPTSL